MSKQHKIRWRESDNQELTRAVRNYNAKVKRLLKKNPQEYKNTLPMYYDSKTEEFTNTLSVRQLKELISTRQDLKREINALKRFSKRNAEEIVVVDGNDYNLKITKWQRTEMNRRRAIINKRRESRLKELEQIKVTQQGEELGYTKADIGMGKITEVNLRPLNAFTPKMTRHDLNWKWRVIQTESQSEYFDKKDFQLKENFIKALEENFNPKDIESIVKDIRDMDIKDFLIKFESESGAFENAYPPNEEQYQAYLEGLFSTWKENKK